MESTSEKSREPAPDTGNSGSSSQTQPSPPRPSTSPAQIYYQSIYTPNAPEADSFRLPPGEPGLEGTRWNAETERPVSRLSVASMSSAWVDATESDWNQAATPDSTAWVGVISPTSDQVRDQSATQVPDTTGAEGSSTSSRWVEVADPAPRNEHDAALSEKHSSNSARSGASDQASGQEDSDPTLHHDPDAISSATPAEPMSQFQPPVPSAHRRTGSGVSVATCTSSGKWILGMLADPNTFWDFYVEPVLAASPAQQPSYTQHEIQTHDSADEDVPTGEWNLSPSVSGRAKHDDDPNQEDTPRALRRSPASTLVAAAGLSAERVGGSSGSPRPSGRSFSGQSTVVPTSLATVVDQEVTITTNNLPVSALTVSATPNVARRNLSQSMSALSSSRSARSPSLDPSARPWVALNTASEFGLIGLAIPPGMRPSTTATNHSQPRTPPNTRGKNTEAAADEDPLTDLRSVTLSAVRLLQDLHGIHVQNLTGDRSLSPACSPSYTHILTWVQNFTLASPSSPSPSLSSHSTFHKIQLANEKKRIRCRKCWTATGDLFIASPCGHGILCGNCLETYKKHLVESGKEETECPVDGCQVQATWLKVGAMRLPPPA